MKDLKDIDFKEMHRDAVDSLEALERLMSMTRKLADFSGEYLGEDSDKEGKESSSEDKEERKKLAVIKLQKMK